MIAGFPDWQDDSAYPSNFEEWSVSQWAWEFLRRNKEYQADYAHYASIPAWLDGGTTGKLSGCPFASWESMEFRYCDPPSLPGETGAEYEARMESDEIAYEHMPLEEYLMEKWGLIHLIDPFATVDDALDLFQPYGEHFNLPPWVVSIPSEYDRKLLGERCPYPQDDDVCQITLRFDLRYSIDQQIEETKQLLIAMKEEIQPELIRKSGPQKPKLPVFLRTFDAITAGATHREIAEKLFPHLDNALTRDPGITRVVYAKEAAEELITSKGYKDLLKWG